MNTEEKKAEELYTFLVECTIATETEISLVECMCGVSLETLEGILYARTGYRSIDQVIEMEGE